jgi:hypothetical protein
MKLMLFVPDQDTPGKKDMSNAFLPEARAIAKFYGQAPEETIKRFPAGAPVEQRRATCTLALRAAVPPLDAIIFVCHGWKGGIQAGFLKAHGLLLARIIATQCKPDAHVVFYACDAARDMDEDAADDRGRGPGGDGGFADGVRDACEVLKLQITVTAHATVGHTTENPFARRFAPNTGGKGGEWYVEPGSTYWPRWVAALKDPRNTLRYRFWTLTRQELEAELDGRIPQPPQDPPLVA